MWVRATAMGYYDHKRRREGAVFELKPITRKRVKDGVEKEVTIRPDQQFSARWMEKLPEAAAAPKVDTTGDKPQFGPGMGTKRGKADE